MTGYTVHTGSNEKFSQGWDQIFTSQSRPKPAAKKNPGKKNTGKSSAKSAAVKKKNAVKQLSTKKVKRGKQT